VGLACDSAPAGGPYSHQRLGYLRFCGRNISLKACGGSPAAEDGGLPAGLRRLLSFCRMERWAALPIEGTCRSYEARRQVASALRLMDYLLHLLFLLPSVCLYAGWEALGCHVYLFCFCLQNTHAYMQLGATPRRHECLGETSHCLLRWAERMGHALLPPLCLLWLRTLCVARRGGRTRRAEMLRQGRTRHLYPASVAALYLQQRTKRLLPSCFFCKCGGARVGFATCAAATGHDLSSSLAAAARSVASAYGYPAPSRSTGACASGGFCHCMFMVLVCSTAGAGRLRTLRLAERLAGPALLLRGDEATFYNCASLRGAERAAPVGGHDLTCNYLPPHQHPLFAPALPAYAVALAARAFSCLRRANGNDFGGGRAAAAEGRARANLYGGCCRAAVAYGFFRYAPFVAFYARGGRCGVSVWVVYGVYLLSLPLGAAICQLLPYLHFFSAAHRR